MISQFFKSVPKSTRTLNDDNNIAEQPQKKKKNSKTKRQFNF